MTIYKDQLEAAYSLLEDGSKWRKGSLDDGECKYCVGGAVLHVCGVNAWETDNRAPAEEFAELAHFPKDASLGQRRYALYNWNDAPERTHAEVLELLRSAIDRAPVRP